MYDALVKNKVKAEMHIFPAGGHGFGMFNSKAKAFGLSGQKFGWVIMDG
jgi:dipeptidyl aminopeptidase/acylaminoacyl peptidase